MTDPASTSLTAAPGRRPRTVVCEGRTLEVPADWDLLPPGDAALTRKVKAGGPSWTVQEKKGRRMFSRGVYAPAERIARAQAEVEATRADPAYQRRLEAGRARRAREQEEYAVEFELHVRTFLDFDPRFSALEGELAKRVAAHATPVGSGTVARTKRIPVERRAEAAVIAWMRHQTTGYDGLYIARVKGRRREVRRELAQRSRALLRGYRRGADPSPGCPLLRALRPAQALAPDTEPAAIEPASVAPATITPASVSPASVSPASVSPPVVEASASAAPGPPPPEPPPSEPPPPAPEGDREAEQRALYEQVRARLQAGGPRRRRKR